MKILRALSCPKNGWGHCSCFGRSLGRSVCLKEHPKSRAVGECRTYMYFYKHSEETPHLAILSAKMCWEYFEWFNKHPKYCKVYTHNLNSFCLVLQWVIIDCSCFTCGKLKHKDSRHKMSKQRWGQGRDCLAWRSAVVCHNMYCLPVSRAQMLQMEGLVCYKTWPLLLNILSLL